MFLALIAAAATAAATPAVPAEQGIGLFSDPAVVNRFVEHIRDHIHLATLADGTPLKKETPDERKQPIIPQAAAKRALDRGMLSGVAEACGGDWRVMSLNPLIDTFRRQGLTPRQIAFATALHDASKLSAPDYLPDGCTPDTKTSLQEALAAERARG